MRQPRYLPAWHTMTSASSPVMLRLVFIRSQRGSPSPIVISTGRTTLRQHSNRRWCGCGSGRCCGTSRGIGLMASTGVGPVVHGCRGSTLAGAAAGGATGSVIGALTQAGVSKNDADIYAEGLRRGGAGGKCARAGRGRRQTAGRDGSVGSKCHRERRGLSPSRMEVIRCLGNAVHSGSNPKERELYGKR